jgi:hypothetical protein
MSPLCHTPATRQRLPLAPAALTSACRRRAPPRAFPPIGSSQCRLAGGPLGRAAPAAFVRREAERNVFRAALFGTTATARVTIGPSAGAVRCVSKRRDDRASFLPAGKSSSGVERGKP